MSIDLNNILVVGFVWATSVQISSHQQHFPNTALFCCGLPLAISSHLRYEQAKNKSPGSRAWQQQ